MAKIRDLGINVIPETMRPPEVGHGGCKHTYQTACCPITCHPTTGFAQQYVECCNVTCHPSTGNVPTCCPLTCYNTTIVQTTCCPVTCHPTTGFMNDCCPGTCHVTTTISSGGSCMHEWIAQLKEQFQQQIAQLEEYEKAMGPRTAEEIDAREKALKAELADLAARRKELKK